MLISGPVSEWHLVLIPENIFIMYNIQYLSILPTGSHKVSNSSVLSGLDNKIPIKKKNLLPFLDIFCPRGYRTIRFFLLANCSCRRRAWRGKNSQPAVRRDPQARERRSRRVATAQLLFLLLLLLLDVSIISSAVDLLVFVHDLGLFFSIRSTELFFGKRKLS